MKRKISSSLLLPAAALLAGAAILMLTLAVPAAADDRDLLRDSSGDPYVFIIFDTSGSMNRSPKCTAAQLNPGNDPDTGLPLPPICTFPCPDGDCYTPMQGDDPNSKFFQAKDALFEVLKEIDDVNFGFATYNQDGLRAASKHWLYEAAPGGVSLTAFGPWPAAGSQEVFGPQWDCDAGTGNADRRTGCDAGNSADLGDEWELVRVRRLSKGGIDFNLSQTIYISSGGEDYEIIYTPTSTSAPLGSAVVTMNVHYHRCTSNNCGTHDVIGDVNLDFFLVDDFFSWDAGVNRNLRRRGFFNNGSANDTDVGGSCEGLDVNTDSAADPFPGGAGNTDVNLRWPSSPAGVVDDGTPTEFLSRGDLLPLGWTDKNKDEILRRLAPNTALNPLATPDFGIAGYFEDKPADPDATVLELRNPAVRPLLPRGRTPLGNSIRSFRLWYTGTDHGDSRNDNLVGWRDLAQADDPDWDCRRKFLLVISDGDETCTGPDACSGTSDLKAQERILTYVIAFGVENSAGNRLSCMAANGGTDEPIFPQNKSELVDALISILGEIRQQSRTFATAAVPTVQAQVSDKIYLTNFTPLNSRSIWDGHVDAYLRPLPLTPAPDFKPDRDRSCSLQAADEQSACHLWDAGEVLLSQAPDEDEIDGGDFMLGTTDAQRRILYTRDNPVAKVPSELDQFEPPDASDPAGTETLWSDLATGLGIVYDPGVSGEVLAAAAQLTGIVRNMVVEKTAFVNDELGVPQLVTTVLGDTFHGNPLLVEGPGNFRYFAADLFADQSSPVNATCSSGNNKGYVCFEAKHRERRKMLAVGANDGQLHFFDAGVFQPADEFFGNGTGKEIFSYMPRLSLLVVRAQATGRRQIFSMDGTIQFDDVFIDPIHDASIADPPDAAEREWRTALIGGMREGGSIDRGGISPGFVSGYYALDITQPDAPSGSAVDTVPSCINYTTPASSGAGCGTLAFPAELWTFTDSLAGIRLDEDGNDQPDLAATWSKPIIGRIKVTVGGNIESRFVAIFGGGFDPINRSIPQSGNFLYMVDIETGLPIYKRRLDTDTARASAPADPAAIDENLDGFLDAVYIGTTGGFMYKVNLVGAPDLVDDVLPVTAGVGVDLPGAAGERTVQRITTSSWDPFKIFDTGGRPIFFAPTVFFNSTLDRFLLAFGSGDRETMWSFGGVDGRFYLIADLDFVNGQTSPALPLDEADFEIIGSDAALVNPASDFVLNPDIANSKLNGWVMALRPDERVISQAFGLAGVLVFSTFQPEVVVFVDGEPVDPDAPPPGGGPGGGPAADPPDVTCIRTGSSRIFVIFGDNANPVLPPTGTCPPDCRGREIPDFVTGPIVEQGSHDNDSTDGSTDGNSEQLDAIQQAMLEALKSFFPKRTKFGNNYISVSGIRSDTGYERYATVPVGTIIKNWKEF